MATIIKDTIEITYTKLSCGVCDFQFYVPLNWDNRKRESKEGFKCPNGCSIAYGGQTKAEKLQEELDLIKRQFENSQQILSDRLLDEINEKNKYKKQVKRIHNGVCPCCNRSFVNLQRHMKTKHPEQIISK